MDRSTLEVLELLFRIVVTIIVVKRAQSRGRTGWPWGLFGFFLPWLAIVAIWFVRRKKPQEQPATIHRPSVPVNSLPAPPPSIAPAAGVSSLKITELKQVDRGNHKLIIKRITGSSSGQTVVLTTVIMPVKEYSDLVLGLGFGNIERERAAILELVKQVFVQREYGARVFESSSAYATYLKGYCPELKQDTDNEWFKTLACHYPAYTPALELHILAFIERQSEAYSKKSGYESITPTLTPTLQPLRNAPPVTINDTSVSKPQLLADEPHTRRHNWAAFQQVLQANGINKLYHFTDRANLASIRSNGGLLSWYSCRQKGISISRPGGSPLSWNLDSSKGLEDYVRLSFVRNHPMGFVARNDGRISDLVILEIDPEVVLWSETKFSVMNAAKNGVTAANTLDKLTSVKFHLFKRRYLDLVGDDKHYYQAEILVHKSIPLQYITNLNQVMALA